MPEEVRPMMAGAYHASNGNDEQVQAAATFAVEGLRQSQAEAASPYTFLEKIPASGEEDTDSLNNINIKTVVLNAETQVVAGLNYRLTVGLMNAEECLGAFKCVVYDRFGDLSVTTWGDEVSCEEALALSTKNQQQEPET